MTTIDDCSHIADWELNPFLRDLYQRYRAGELGSQFANGEELDEEVMAEPIKGETFKSLFISRENCTSIFSGTIQDEKQTCVCVRGWVGVLRANPAQFSNRRSG